MNRSSLVESLAQQLAAELAKVAQEHVYVLVDGAMQRDAWRWLSERGECVAIQPQEASVSSADLSALPLLAPIPPAGPARAMARLRHTVEWAIDTHGVSWFASDMPISHLTSALSVRMDATLSEDMPVVLRYADARVLPVLFNVLDMQQRYAFFGVASAWWYLDRRCALRHLALEPRGAGQEFCVPLKLSADQEAAMLEAAEPDAVLRLLHEHDGAALERLPIQERHAFVVSQIERARGWAIESTADLALYCMLALSEGEHFDEQANWQAALAPVRERKSSLAEAVAETSP